MPAMPRISAKQTKIAFKILGKPANMREEKSKKQTKTDKRLVFEETMRVR